MIVTDNGFSTSIAFTFTLNGRDGIGWDWTGITVLAYGVAIALTIIHWNIFFRLRVIPAGSIIAVWSVLETG